MGRPPLPVGSFGRIDMYEDRSGRVRARASFRGYDGVRRPVTRWGDTRGEADERLRLALRDRVWVGDGEIGPGTRVADAARLWLSELEHGDLAAGTRALYTAAVRLCLLPALGELRIAELRVPIIDRALDAITASHGPNAARAARRALSGTCRAAVRHGALPFNPVRDTRPIRMQRKRARSLTDAEARDLLHRLRRDNRAVLHDLPDLVEFMLGTGLRIGEASAVRLAVLDLAAKTVHINATVVRVAGKGVRIQPRTKTAGSERILVLPDHLVALLQQRIGAGRVGPGGVLFSSTAGMIRDPSNTQGDLRAALDRIGYPWVTSHVFRKTVASRLDDAGFSIRQIADQLGHTRPSTTLDSYLGRRAITTAAHAAALEPVHDVPGLLRGPATRHKLVVN
jgi:integrase